MGRSRRAARRTDVFLRRRLADLRSQLAAAQAASSNRALLIATTSHDIREPMNGVLGMARLLRETKLDEEQADCVATIIDSAETLLALVNDLLDIGRIDAGRLELAPVDFALQPFLARLQAMMQPRAERAGLDLRLDLAPGTPPVLHTDPARLRQILVNLVGNGIKFTERGHVSIDVASSPAVSGRMSLTIAVTDTGIGIPPERLSGLFDAYAQAGGDVAGRYGGSGLGLAISRRLATALGGTLEAASRPGGGTVMTLRLDLPAAPSGEPSIETAEAAVCGASLLVVDAQDRTREALAGLAAHWGMLVRTARSAGQALSLCEDAAARECPFDVVLIDRALPDLSGNLLGSRIGADRRFGRPALVLLDGSGQRGDATAARSAGFSAYLPKDVAPDALLRCLRQVRAGAPTDLVTVHTLEETRPPPLKVLVADDNPVNRRLLGILLERAGCEARPVENGAEALAALRSQHFDLVLMDVQMPVLDGLEATRRIRSLDEPCRAGTPIIAITANAMQGDADRCLAAGMNGYLTKPVSPQALHAEMSRLARAVA